MSSRRVLAASAVVAAVAATALPVGAAAANPVCAPPVPTELCGGRVFAEPLLSATALTWQQVRDGFAFLAEEHADWITYADFGEPSADGFPMFYVEVTNPDSDIPLEDRKIVLVNQSIHGNEPGGREGGPRYVEDLVTGVDEDTAQLLEGVRLIQTFVNPDGWTSGDHDQLQTNGGLGLWVRQNGEGPVAGVGDLGLGVDLNRQAPWRGRAFDGPEALVAPEARSLHDFVLLLREQGDIQAAVDIHGEVPDAAAVIMLSSGQFDLDGAINQRVQGDAVVEATFEDLDESQASLLVDAAGADAAILHASSEFGAVNVGGSGTGFFGDWISQPEGGDAASLSTIELFSFTGSPIGDPGVNSLTGTNPILQVYRDTVAGILRGLVEQAALEHDTSLVLDGTVGWLDDLDRVTDPVRGVEVSAADFFADLAPQVEGDLRRVTRITRGELQRLDHLVVSTDALRDDARAVAEVRRWVARGGNLVLTDAGVRLTASTARLWGVPAERRLDDIGLTVYDRAHPLADGIRDIAYMNTETATMGLEVTGAGTVPTWGIPAAEITGAGGTVAATTTPDGPTASVFELPAGRGSVRGIGVLLPSPSADGDVPFGLNGHGVLDTGYLVLANALDAQVVTTTTGSVPGLELPASLLLDATDVVAAQDVVRPALPATPASGAVTAAGLVGLLAAGVLLGRRRA